MGRTMTFADRTAARRRRFSVGLRRAASFRIVASHDAGVQVPCPACGQVVLQKAMIPVLGDGGAGVSYLCQACARALIVSPSVPGADSGANDTDDASAARAGDDDRVTVPSVEHPPPG